MKYIIFIFIVLLFGISSCRENEYVVPTRTVGVETNSEVNKKYLGLYILNQGNMGSNKASLDFLDFSTSNSRLQYYRNIYSDRNPNTIKELGDVANDMQIYGSRLYIVVNMSHKIEVLEASTAKRIGQINIPNPRYITFKDGYAYVSSYVSTVVGEKNGPLGEVCKIDTATMSIVDRVTVGYQPDGLSIVSNKLYVANSGGYRNPNYEKDISQINLNKFIEERRIKVDINLNYCRADKYGQLWVTSRGNYKDVKPRLFVLGKDASNNMQVTDSFDIAVSDFDIVDDTLYYYTTEWNGSTMSNTINYGLINIKNHSILSTSLFSSDEIKNIKTPYGILVDPMNKDFYLMDAKNYVSSGELFHFLKDGSFDYKISTGDIPCRGFFVSAFSNCDINNNHNITEGYSPYISAVDEYVPAPGQFVNTLPQYINGDDAKSMVLKCTQEIANNKRGTVTLGAWGGYITFHFDHSIVNVKDEYDFSISGNAFLGNSEPGIVMVSKDVNKNGLPDDEWYELSGSADTDSIGKVIYGYSTTYMYVAMSDIPWIDNKGINGTIPRNIYHSQEYYPLWLRDKELTFNGTLLPKNAYDNSGDGTHWTTSGLRYGYVDNYYQDNPNINKFNIEWAVDKNRQKITLDYIDFIRVYSAEQQVAGWLGETSTEVTGAQDLHLEASIKAKL